MADSRGEENAHTVPLRRLEIVLHKLTKVAIPLHLEILSKHRNNIDKFQRLSEWDAVHKEQINASRTVQQLKADITDIENVQNQVCEAELAELDRRMSPIKQEVLAAVEEFLCLHKGAAYPLAKPAVQQDDRKLEYSDDPNMRVRQRTVPSNAAGNDDSLAAGLLTHEQNSAADAGQLLIDDLTPIKKEATESWNGLYEDLLELNVMMREFSQVVHRHQEDVDSIEANVLVAGSNVEQGKRDLGKAAKLKAAMYPISGGLVGGLLGGPVGLVMGLKVGAAAALVGGGAGLTIGHLVKKRQNKSVEIELDSMTPNAQSTSQRASPGK